MKEFDLETKRLRLMPYILEDAKEFQLLNNDAFIRKYLWDNKIIDAMTADQIMEQNIRHFEENRFGLWKICLKERETTIGYVGLWYFFNELQPQLIYALLKHHTEKGYATEASSAIVDYAFDELRLDYIIAATDEPHLASQKVAQRLGMSIVEKRVKDDGTIIFYRIQKQEYEINEIIQKMMLQEKEVE
ncbi:GNAT family N-acetyltransferase [Allomuricauda sp. SCSIO 65647]|uniref:GNAT family N-acetyltransferase n=1 Tax=Allomuricauda sp. SCSIO 65647 TaxID=2908843 RepID=UPI001F1E5AC3|nr:GNAT family N-acetyltransferase [Muricauda sp. SCSIO 65647]UJH67798.1 GNAT family N-acetyltransferase [Muricauda sp. SCSIO 65647]